MALSRNSRETLLSLLEMRRDQEACNVKRALRSAEYKRGMAAEVEYVRMKKASVQQLQGIIDELKDDGEDTVLSWPEYEMLMDALNDKMISLDHLEKELLRSNPVRVAGGMDAARLIELTITEDRARLAGVIDKMDAMFGGGDPGDG